MAGCTKGVQCVSVFHDKKACVCVSVSLWSYNNWCLAKYILNAYFFYVTVEITIFLQISKRHRIGTFQFYSLSIDMIHFPSYYLMCLGTQLCIAHHITYQNLQALLGIYV